MGLFLVKCGVFGAVGWIIWDAGYKRGKGDLWEFLAKNYIVLPKGSYYCSKVENKQINHTKKWRNKNEKSKKNSK